MIKPLLCASVCVVAVVFAAPAHADSGDDADFVNAIQEHGIKVRGGPDQLIRLGHVICNLLSDGYSVNGVADRAALYAPSDMSADDVRFVVQTSVAAYCPQYIT
jgi:hypothetical protein